MKRKQKKERFWCSPERKQAFQLQGSTVHPSQAMSQKFHLRSWLVDPKKHLNSTTIQADDRTNASRLKIQNTGNTARRKRDKSNALKKGCRQHASYGVRPRNVSGSDCQLASLQYMPLALSSFRTFGSSFCHTPYFVAIMLVWRCLLTIRVG